MAPRLIEDAHPGTFHDESNTRDLPVSDLPMDATTARELEFAARLLLLTRKTSASVHFANPNISSAFQPLEKSATTVDHNFHDDTDDSRLVVSRRSSWLMPQELEEIRLGAKRKCIELRTIQYQNCDLCMAHRKITLMLKSDFKNIVKLSATTPDDDLSKWCSFEDGRRGLERFASHAYNVLRNNDIYQTRMSVLQEQCTQREQGIHCPERIARVAQRASRRARTFARFFGAADANEAKKLASPKECSTPHAIEKREFLTPFSSEIRTTRERFPSNKKKKQAVSSRRSP
jgi:hypothetical protein